MGQLQAWRVKLMRPGDQLLDRIQWLFVLLNCLLAATSPLDLSTPSAPPWPRAGVLLAAAIAFGIWSVLYFRRRGGGVVLDLVPLILLFIGGVAGGGAEWMFARMYVGVFLASMYRPGRGRMVFLASSYLTVYLVAGAISGEPVVVAGAISEGVSLFVVVGIMQTLAAAVKRHERFARRDALLTQVVGRLMGERNGDRINQIVADAAYDLVAVPGALVTIWKADGSVLRRVGLAGRESHPFVAADLSRLPDEFRAIYNNTRPTYLDAATLNAIHNHYGVDEKFVAAVVAPMTSEGGPSGLIVVGSPTPLDEDLLQVFERFAHEAALAQQLAEREAMLAGMVQNSSDIIAVVDNSSVFTFVSAAVTTTAGVAPADLVGKTMGSLLFHAGTREPVAEASHIEARIPTSLQLDSGKAHRDVEVTVNPLPDGTTILNIRDVSERRRLEAEIEYRAFHDTITGLPNRELLIDRLDHALRRHVNDGALLAVVVLDIDEFKAVNDSLGHAAGDALLSEFGRRLGRTVRGVDTAARLGGDEFGLVLELLDTPEQGVAVADRVLGVLREPVMLDGQELLVSASIGLALSSDATTSDDLLRNADLAMYEAKRAGKNRREMFVPQMLAHSINRLELRVELEGALRREEFTLHYQPIMRLDTEAIDGFEALVRWNHPVRGLVPPGDFIPLAEDTGLIIPLGQWVLEQACREVSRWQAVAERPIGLSVNLSAVQLRSPEIIDDVALALSGSGLDPACLTLEVTETALLGDTKAVADILDGLKALGVRLAIDDFGTGYSSFAHLQLLPVDVIKVDRSFVSVLGQGPEQASLAEAILNIARTLGLATVAEGVETQDQSELLQRWGCSHAQGWLWHPALPADQAVALVARPAAHLAVRG